MTFKMALGTSRTPPECLLLSVDNDWEKSIISFNRNSFFFCSPNMKTFFFFFLVELGFELRTSPLQSIQAHYHLNHTSSPFCSGYFGDGGESLEMAGLALNIDFLISVSQVARITGVSHWHPLHLHFFFLKIWWS
jgi:hypothetical protein